MASQSVAELVEILERDQFLEYSQLEELKATLARRFQDPKALAKDLLQRGWLSPYQVNQLLTGKAEELVLAPYLIMERLGEGAMGQVFKARHQTMRRIVALKVVHRRKLADPEAVQLFYHEVQAASQITHANVVHAYDAGPIGDTHFLAMELVEGSDLDRRVKKEGPLPVAEATDLVRQIALGLQAIADAGLVHRDIKPANILVAKKKTKADAAGAADSSFGSSASTSIQSAMAGDPTPWGRVKILDLGLASLRSSKDATSSSDGILVGTPDYVAPEQALDPDHVDIRSDLYSLGGTLYFMLTGQPPFPEGNWMEKLRKHATEEPVPVEQRRRGITPAVAAVVKRLLAKRPEQRFRSPAELVNVLTSILATGNWPKGMAQDAPATPAAANGNIDKMLQERYAKKQRGPAARALKAAIPVAKTVGRVLAWALAPVAAGWRRLSPTTRMATVACLILAVILYVVFGSRAPTRDDKNEPPPAKSTDRGKDLVLPPFSIKLPTAYAVGETPQATAQGALALSGLPALSGPWYQIGPFDNPDGKGFATVYPPEKGIDLSKTYPGKNNQMIGWKPFPEFKPGVVVSLLPLYEDKNNGCCYLYHEIEAPAATTMPLSLGSDDTLTVWLNGKKLLANNAGRGAAPDQDKVTLDLKAGKNQLLLKICNGGGDWGAYAALGLPKELAELVQPATPPALVVRCGRGSGAEQEEKVDLGYGYNLRKGSGFNGWQGPITHCWADGESLRFDVHVPARTAGRLYLHIADVDSGGRRERLKVNGKVIGDYASFDKTGKMIVVPISGAEQQSDIISIQIDKLAGINAVISTVAFYPDAK